MIAHIEKSALSGVISAPPSKSMSHRLLILAAMSGGACKVDNLDWSEDVLAMLDCLSALGADCRTDGDSAYIDSANFLKTVTPDLNCRESGNTLRFMIPLCLTLGIPVTLHGSARLMERPQGVYETLCREHGFTYQKGEGSVTVCGTLSSGICELDGSVSSQFITGMIFALLSLDGESEIRIKPPFESRSYVDLTLRAVEIFGGNAHFSDDYTIKIKGRTVTSKNVTCEGDYSNAAFLDAFNSIGGNVKVNGLSDISAQGDRVYKQHFAALIDGTPTIDISDCPDLGPVLMAVAALKNGCTLTGTRRLAIKESDRGTAMSIELRKFGLDVELRENEIIVPKAELHRPSEPLYGHNDHRIVMSLAVMCTVLGGEIDGCEAVRKTYPNFFDEIQKLGAKITIE